MLDKTNTRQEQQRKSKEIRGNQASEPTHALIDCVVGEAGIEPTTPGLEGRCSIQLSYSPVLSHCSFELAGAGTQAARTASAKAWSAVPSA
jgi:hypothetical protein